MAVDAEPWALLSIGVAFVLLRLYARWRHVGVRNFQPDDYLMLVFAESAPTTKLTTLPICIISGLCPLTLSLSQLGFATDVTLAYTRRTLNPDSLEYYDRQSGSKIQVAGWSVYVFNLWVVKTAFAFFFSRLTSGLSRMRMRIHIAYGLLAVTYTFVALGLLLSCRPIHHFWQINPDPGPLCKPTNSPFYVLSVLISDIVTDLYLVSIPLPLLLRAKIPIGKKLILIGLFCGSFVVIAAGIARGVAILTAGPEGAISGSQWACRETFVAAVVGNLPASQPLFRSWATKIGLLSSSHPTEDPSHRLVSVDRDREGGGVPIAHHTATAWASEEHNIGGQESLQSSSQSGGDLNQIAVTHEFIVHSQQS
ncbi:hypothetical protein F5Y08DRAFT_345218 [Xylaria arbuscula]|nr:hypothetical protein F5Y08DRAFT_345218 [Xylaria arbuscula]